eukprot:TRINITY_DN9531_c0_g2_i1.p1 TRINITY_DN9531_c0_g2~~TRINITY_DN9531_c0_g2_i1.p1  ORF type:complete len:340 (+),score=108.87 TRINITY_DN9531_c0_g2_i1:54-1073(+)
MAADGRVPMWLDCDPGHDDAAAILLAAGHPKIKLIGISTVSGNVSVEKTTRNAARILSICGPQHRDLKIHRGAERPLIAAKKHDEEIHGKTGMDGSAVLDAFCKGMSVNHTATLLETITGMADAIMSEPNPVDVVAVGSLTNIALLFSTVPEALQNVRQIALMGGAMGVGNRHPVAEFNIICDPEAAEIVFNLPVKVVMAPLELTHTVRVTPEVQSTIRSRLRGSNLSQVVLDLTNFFKASYEKVFGFPSPPLHDPCAVAYCIAPELFTVNHYHVDVIHGGHFCAGQTVCDIWGSTDKPKNVHVASAVNLPAFWELMYTALESLNKTSQINSFRPPARL